MLLARSLETFVREMWEEVPGAGFLTWNWHLSTLCSELQQVAERVFRGEPKQYDVVFNVSPGTSKSTICSILFPTWIWTRMPSARIISASHTDQLVLDLASKSRYVLLGEKYQYFWPSVTLREDQGAKSYYANTEGGDRLTCTVAGKSPMGFHAHFLIVDDPIDPKKAVSALELKTAADFMTNVLPSRKVDKAVSVTFLIMQRLHQDDPTGILLKRAKQDGGTRLKHLCLPAEATEDIQPPGLRQHYVDGLMDPVRLPRAVLNEFKKTMTAYGYAGQFLQSPIPLGGGMFKPQYFNQRTKAAPYEATRIRYWDRASTKDGGCFTAGVLLALDKEGNYHVENVVRGQWEPDERNQNIRATALRDRTRYGPNQEPTIWVEAEGGSSGKDAWKAIARALAGFTVREDRVSGKKDTRAEPWSCQLAAGNVYLVEDGSWDIQAYIDEHVNFRPSEDGPLGRFKDQVDASSGAFNLLSGYKRSGPVLQTFRLGEKKAKGLRIVLCTEEQLAQLVLEQRSLLVVAHAKAPGRNGELPPHGLHKLLDSVVLECDDIQPAELQADWKEPPEAALFTTAMGKAIWGKLLRQRTDPVETLVVADGGNRIAESVGLAVCDMLALKREMTIYRIGHEDWQATKDSKPGNKFVYDQMRLARSMVL